MSEASALFSSFGQNAGYVQELFELYRADRNLVTPTWAAIFDKHLGIETPQGSNGHAAGHHIATNGKSNGRVAHAPSVSADLHERVFRLIRAYRERGHLKAKVNPISQGVPLLPVARDLQLEQYGFSPEELRAEVPCERFQGKSAAPLSELLNALEQTYCGSIGFEWTHLLSLDAREFLRERIESRPMRANPISPELQKRILKKLVEGEVMESDLHKKYVGHKRFSLQGGEALIPMLDSLLNQAVEGGVHEAIIGMAHRGRLNVLINTVGKPLADLFNEFEDQSAFSVLGSGDVKYHLGYSGIHTAPGGGTLKIGMAPNPSHLEFVNPVLEGICRARQDIAYNRERASVLPILIHGDAAFIGQGVVFETLNLAALPGYATGGSVHIVINNQVGFTTPPDESRSTVYCTELAKGFEAPVLHVNGEDPEAACWAMELALKFRNRFQRDIVIDLICYRKYGHNEGDDPSFTQPLMYAEIAGKKTPGALYGASLVERGVLLESEVKGYYDEYSAKFKAAEANRRPGAQGEACAVHGKLVSRPPKTAVNASVLKKIGNTLITYPAGFAPHPKLHKILEKRVETLDAGKGIDWGFGEGLAFGSLLLEGKSVRLTGQDCGRGTFSQRHLVLSHHEDMRRYVPFDQLAQEGGSQLDIINSSLSEAAVLGFEFGYGSVQENGLVLWEAQFGDFANGAQVLIDQFISSSEAKWGQRSSVVLMLPHGFEGQGPEHSSARLERFLQLCAEGNMGVCYPTKASQHFHLLRRQALSEIKRPLVIMTPKSLLRHPGAACSLDSFTEGGFNQVILDEIGAGKASDTVVLLAGKVFYDLAGALEKANSVKARVVRVEELYPFPAEALSKALKGVKPKKVVWVQEEPKNMGSWSFIAPYLKEHFGMDPVYVGRAASASPATGSGKAHAREQEQIVRETIAALS